MTSTGKTRFRARLMRSLEADLKVHGFTLKLAREVFLRKWADRTDRFRLVFLDGKPGYDVQIDIAVRFERVEEIFHRSSGFPAKSQKNTPTVVANVGELMAKDFRAYRSRIISEGDIPSAAQEIVEVFRGIALPYYDKFGSLSAVDHELNERPFERTPNRGTPWLRCSAGIIVAKLVNRPNFTDLEACYRAATLPNERY